MKTIEDKDIRKKIEDYCIGGLGCDSVGNIWEVAGEMYKVELYRKDPARLQVVHVLKGEVEDK